MKTVINTADLITIVGSLACFIAFVLLVNGISTGFFVDMQNSVTGTILVQTAGMSPEQALGTLLGSFVKVIFAMVALTLGFAFLAAHGAFSGERKIGAMIGLASGAVMLAAFHFTIIAALLFVSMIILCTYIIPLSNTYFQELTRWKFFRTGSHSISKALLIFNTMLAIGIFLTVSQNLNSYSDSFKQGFSSTLSEAVMTDEMMAKAIDDNYPGIAEEQRQQLMAAMKEQTSSTVDKTIAESPVFKAYITWLPLVIAGTVWVTIEFLRSLIFSNIAGIFSSIVIRIYGKLVSYSRV